MPIVPIPGLTPSHVYVTVKVVGIPAAGRDEEDSHPLKVAKNGSASRSLTENARLLLWLDRSRFTPLPSPASGGHLP